MSGRYLDDSLVGLEDGVSVHLGALFLHQQDLGAFCRQSVATWKTKVHPDVYCFCGQNKQNFNLFYQNKGIKNIKTFLGRFTFILKSRLDLYNPLQKIHFPVQGQYFLQSYY